MIKRYINKFLNLNIASDVSPKDRGKLRILNLNLLMGFLINVILLILFVANGNMELIFLELIIITLSAVLPFLFMNRKRYLTAKIYTAAVFPLILLAVNIVKGDLATELYFSAVGILVLYIFDTWRSRIAWFSWVLACYLVELVLIKGGIITGSLVDFGDYSAIVNWWVYISGFLLNATFVLSMLFDNQKYEVKLESQNNALEILNKDKDKFMSIISHDLRSPFTAILGLLDVMSNELEEFTKEELKSMVEVLSNSANNAHELLNDLLIWSTTALGKLEYQPSTINLSELIKESFRPLQQSAALKSIQLEQRTDESVSAKADPKMLKIILRNLLTNAIKFTPDGGHVRVETQLENGKVTVFVKDSGIGMSQNQQELLFSPGKVHSTKGTANETGTGLGIFLCKELMDKHGSLLKVESSKGVGSTFSFDLAV